MKRLDRDRLFESLHVFASEIGFPLERWQSKALSVHEREQRETAIRGPRRSGKSRGAAILALYHCFRRPGAHALVISSSEAVATKLLDEARRIALASPLLSTSIIEQTAHKLTFSNGSTLWCVAATEESVRGSTASLVICDEAAMLRDSVVSGAARPIIASEPDGRFLLISSASRSAGAFYDAIMRGQAGSAHTAAFTWQLTDCHWISATEIAAARESMSDLRFRSEYLGEFASGADALFTLPEIDGVTHEIVLRKPSELRPGARMAGAVDWGARADQSALTALARTPQGVLVVVCAYAWPSGYPMHRTVQEIVDCPGHFGILNLEANGLGESLSADVIRHWRSTRRPEAGGAPPAEPLLIDPLALANAEDYGSALPWSMRPRPQAGFRTTLRRIHVSSEIKSATYGALKLLINRGVLILPSSAEELRRQLLALRIDLTATGVERVEASSGHDDLSDALALSLSPYRAKDGRWRCFVADVAEQKLPARDGELELPREPTLISVTKDEHTTAPIGAIKDPDAELRKQAREALEALRQEKEASNA